MNGRYEKKKAIKDIKCHRDGSSDACNMCRKNHPCDTAIPESLCDVGISSTIDMNKEKAMKGVIVCGGGSVKDYTRLRRYFDPSAMVICADGGARHLRQLEVLPDILIGDFDSISSKDYEDYINAGVEMVKYPLEKDMTDSQLAVELAVERGCREIVLLGALGTRLDHSIANIFLLKRLLDSGIKGILADENNEAVLIDQSICIQKEQGAKVSLIPVSGDAKGVTTKGLYYPLYDATLVLGSTWGVSNEFSEDTARVTVKEGLLLVIKSRD